MTYNAKLGLALFVFYSLFYGGFMFLNAFSPTTMEQTPIAGVNLAILYGFGLILGAFLISLVYGFMCRDEDDVPSEREGK